MSFLSVCIICKNEKDNITRCLDSVSAIADEIIVNDTGSNDGTIELLEEYRSSKPQIRLLQNGWQDDFSLARNQAADSATGKWLFHIDSDEELISPDLLIKTLKSQDDSIGGILWNLESYAMINGQQIKQLTSVLRIYRNGFNIRFEGRVHEQLLPSIVKAGLKVSATEVRGIHHGYALSGDQLKAKQFRNINLLEKALQDDGTNSYTLLQLGKSYEAVDEVEKAADILEKAIQNSSLAHGLQKCQILNQLASVYKRLGRSKDSILLLEESLQIEGKQHFPHLLLAEIHTQSKNYLAALDHYSMILKQLSDSSHSSLLGEIVIDEADIRLRKAAIYYELKEFTEAENEINIGLEVNPQSENLNTFKKALENLLSSVNRSENLPSVSLCMIVRDEEEHLPEALNSVKDLVDQIVIVDTGSKDATVDIAKSYNAEIYNFEWIDDFAAARNESLKHAKSDWILYLDADERLAPHNVEKLKLSLKNLPDSVGGVICTLESSHTKLTGGSEIHRGGYPRLFRNLGYPSINFQGRVHEQITPSLKEAELSIVKSDIVIKHLGYDCSREEMEAKVKRNYRLLLNHVKEEPLNGYAWYQLGQTLGQMGLISESENAIQFALQTQSLADSVKASAYSTLSQYAGGRKEFDKALEYAEQSLSIAPKQIYPMNLKAYALVFLGKKTEALALFNSILEIYDQSADDIPSSGYDILLSKEVIYKGIEMAKR